MNNLILASTSPRRAELLSGLGFEYKIIPPNFNEKTIVSKNPKIFAMVSAYRKAYSIFRQNEEAIVLGADTIVVINEKILGKPGNRQDAFQMLDQLQGRNHQVISGVSILSKRLKVVDYVSSNVEFKALTEKEIEKYLDTKEYMDKAGAYGIQGLGKNLVQGYTGELNNIIGLPTEYVKKIFEKILSK